MSKSSGRTFAIGDIHGCAEELWKLLRELPIEPQDQVVFLGDYVDRGPDSRRVIDLVLNLSKRVNVVALKGNHEALFLDFLEHPETQGSGLFVLNGGTATLANYMHVDGAIEIPEEHLRFLKTLRLHHETDDYFFVHAGVPEQPLATIDDEEHEHTMLWTRSPFLTSHFRWEKTIVHGHTPVHGVETLPNRINLDTACVYDGHLTAMEFPSRRIYQVEKGHKGEPVLYAAEPDSARISTRFTGRLPVLAGRAGEAVRSYETLNYNTFGFLMRAIDLLDDHEIFAVDDPIVGKVGPQDEGGLDFRGTVVRRDTRGAFTVWGVRIDFLANDRRKVDFAIAPKKS